MIYIAKQNTTKLLKDLWMFDLFLIIKLKKILIFELLEMDFIKLLERYHNSRIIMVTVY
jgi:hypothetical protein